MSRHEAIVDWNDPRVLGVFAGFIRGTCLASFGRDLCIASTRIAVDVLTLLGGPVQPLTVEVGIYNQAFMNLFRQRGQLPVTDEDAEVWIREGASFQMVGVPDPGSSDGWWQGHLVPIIGKIDKKWLVDLSIAQANHYEKGIYIDSTTICRVTPEFLRGAQRLSFTDRTLTFIYQARPNDLSYQETPDWNCRKYDVSDLAEAIIEGVRDFAAPLSK